MQHKQKRPCKNIRKKEWKRKKIDNDLVLFIT